ncbi:MAG: hypothetical protein M1814_002333 [Vezdaea aestivalis]|nr:MAG: hypothetical protein M1814_002333 [Vezdaea aestivalis]
METPPVYRINLDVAPEERYVHVVRDFIPQLQAITSLFDEVVRTGFPFLPTSFVRLVARGCLWGVWDRDETRELRGISSATHIPMYLLVAFNTFLDSFMGCTSGAVRERASKKKDNRMVHFRILDWDMPQLRELVVYIEYYASRSSTEKIATNITYAGYLGCLTGVRKGLSLSLNFRPTHHCATTTLITHQILVMLGIRPSIATKLRALLLTESCPSLNSILERFPKEVCTPCYTIFCDGDTAVVVEKDHKAAHIRSATDFIVHTNHDSPNNIEATTSLAPTRITVAILIEGSKELRSCITDKYKSFVKHSSKTIWEEGTVDHGSAVPMAKIIQWIAEYPTSNEQTHFACILDPKKGSIRHFERGSEYTFE